MDLCDKVVVVNCKSQETKDPERYFQLRVAGAKKWAPASAPSSHIDKPQELLRKQKKRPQLVTGTIVATKTGNLEIIRAEAQSRPTTRRWKRTKQRLGVAQSQNLVAKMKSEVDADMP